MALSEDRLLQPERGHQDGPSVIDESSLRQPQSQVGTAGKLAPDLGQASRPTDTESPRSARRCLASPADAGSPRLEASLLRGFDRIRTDPARRTLHAVEGLLDVPRNLELQARSDDS